MAKLEDRRLEEVLKRISESPQINILYHPSECVGMTSKEPLLDNKGLSHKNNRKILDVINSYHIYCKICQHHYYSCSKLNDINSFFQIHINSFDHVWNRGNQNLDMTKPIFLWEKWLCTGFCAICNKSGIEAFFIDTELDAVSIILEHLKKIRHLERDDLIQRKPVDRIMAKLDLFSKMYICKLSNGQYFCKVCNLGIKLEALLEYHFYSEQHCKKFCELLKKKLNVDIDERHVNFGIEELAEKMSEIPAFRSPPPVINKKKNNIKYDSGDYVKSESYFLKEFEMGFSPEEIEKFQSMKDEDLRQVIYCALCQEKPNNMEHHVKSNSHQLRVMIFNQCSSVRPISLIDYLYNCRSTPKKLINEITKYKKYKLLLQKQGLDFGIPFKPEYVNVNLNLNKSCSRTSHEKINGEIDVEVAETRKKAAVYVEDSQQGPSKSTEIEKTTEKTVESAKIQNRDKDAEKSENLERQLMDVKIKVEKMSKEELSVVHSFKKLFLESVIPHGDQFFCIECNYVMTENEVENHIKEETHLAKEKQKHRVFQYCENLDFFNVIEKWSYHNESVFVCVLCGLPFLSPQQIFTHLKKNKHVTRYEGWKKGTVKPFSPCRYSLDVKKSMYICEKCGIGIHEIKSPQDFNVLLAIEKIKFHEREVCGKPKKVTSTATVNYKTTLEEVTNELMKLSVIGERPSKENNRAKNVRETNENIAKESPSKKLTPKKEPKNCVEKKVGETQKVSPNKINAVTKKGNMAPGSPRNNSENEEPPKAKNKDENMKKRDSGKNKPKTGIRLNQTLDAFLNRCGGGLTEFLCGICLTNGDLRAVKDHVNSESHIMNEEFIRQKWNVNFSICKFCKLLILGTSDMSNQHYSSSYHTDREGVSVGKPLSQPINKIVEVLIVRGVPEMERRDKEKFIKWVLRPYGKISRILVKKSFIEVEFFDERVLAKIASMKRIFIADKICLTFSTKKISQELEIAMKSNGIYILSHAEKAEKLVSFLVEKADDMLSSVEERKKEDILCEALRKAIGRVYKDCKCFKFGSRVTGLTLGDCDLDVFVDYGNAYYGDNKNPPDQARIVQNVVPALKASQQFSHILGIEHCRVPIVNCMHISTKIHCDVSFRNGLSCENTNLIKFMISLDERVKGVILFLKYWTVFNDLHGKPFFSSYALTMLVFFYLQQEPNPVLPTVAFLKSCYGESERIIGEWDCGFTTNKDLVPKSKNTDSAIQLILGFFNFCNKFDFSENAISPLTGKPLERKILHNAVKIGLPMPYKKYEAKIAGCYRTGDAICIIDPFDLSHNLTKWFPILAFQKFLYLCRISADLLSNSLQSKEFLHFYGNPPVYRD